MVWRFASWCLCREIQRRISWSASLTTRHRPWSPSAWEPVERNHPAPEGTREEEIVAVQPTNDVAAAGTRAESVLALRSLPRDGGHVPRGVVDKAAPLERSRLAGVQ